MQWHYIFLMFAGHIYLFWLREMGPKEKGRFHIRIQVPGRPRPELNCCLCHFVACVLFSECETLPACGGKHSGLATCCSVRWSFKLPLCPHCQSQHTPPNRCAFPFVLFLVIKAVGWKLHCRSIVLDHELCEVLIRASNHRPSCVCLFICLFICKLLNATDILHSFLSLSQYTLISSSLILLKCYGAFLNFKHLGLTLIFNSVESS